MTADTHSGLLTTRAADGRTMIGHVVVCRAGGEAAVAHLSPDGVVTGEWVVPARKSLAEHCAGRVRLVWSAAEARGGVVRVSVPDALAEVAEARRAYAEVVAEQQAARLESGDLRWPVALPDPLPTTAEGLRRRARFLVPPDVSEAVARQKLICGLGGWVVRRWQENAVALERREYLRARFGEPSVLPPRWEGLVADACGGKSG